MKRAVFATICLFCIVVWPAAAQISPDLVAMAPAGEVDRLITTREFEINKPFAGDMTLLSSACLNEDGREVVDALLAKGGDPNFKTYGGMTPLMYAASNRHGKRLLPQKAAVYGGGAECNGQSPPDGADVCRGPAQSGICQAAAGLRRKCQCQGFARRNGLVLCRTAERKR